MTAKRAERKSGAAIIRVLRSSKLRRTASAADMRASSSIGVCDIGTMVIVPCFSKILLHVLPFARRMAKKPRSNGQKSFQPPPPTFADVEHQPVAEFTRKAYLDYSMYVILARARAHL